MSDIKKEQSYTAQSIKVLEGLEGVRKRPAMYIGGTGIDGLHHLVYEIVDNSVDEALAGFCNKIEVALLADGACSVKDNGRGIPTDIHETEKISAAEVVMTKLHAGGKFNKDSYKYSGGLHGVGAAVVNGLSKKLELIICREGKKFQQFYAQGIPQGPLSHVGESSERGTTVKFYPDPEIFPVVDFNYETLVARFREIAFLNKGLTISISSEVLGQEQTFYFEGGISSFIEHINKKKTALFPSVISMNKSDDQFELDFAFQYNDSYQELTYSFVNNIRTAEGGTHEAGFRSALTKVSNKYAQAFNMVKDEALSSDDVREGLVCVLSIKVPEPQFEGQTKNKLGNAEVKGIVDSWIYSFLDIFFEENPAITKIVLQKAVQAQQARLAAKKAREITRKKNIFESSVLPGKLADCSESNPAKTEIFIVEGDSAGGSAKQARDRFTQAILPIRGKILNVEKTSIARALSNNEVKDLITAIGAGVGKEDFNVDKVRYHKIMIMTDADVDGAHIRILLLTFFFRYMPQIIEKGFLYIAAAPLYKAKVGKLEKYLKNDSELRAFIFDWAKKNISIYMGKQEVSSEDLALAVDHLQSYEEELFKVSNQLEIPVFVLNHIVTSAMNQEYNEQSLENDILDILQKKLTDFAVEIESVKTGEIESLLVKLTKDKNSFKFNYQFLFSAEVKYLVSLMSKISAYNQPLEISLVGAKNKNENVFGLLDLANKIIKFGKSNLTLQRYKGLGEMNPDQLWETTMNPEKRTLLQVSVGDAIVADQTFSALMGEDVDPRKQFIEQHAHFVRNLDV